MVLVNLQRCEGQEHCRDPHEIDEFLDEINLTYYLNTNEYNTNEFEDQNKIITRKSWINVSGVGTQRSEILYIIREHALEAQDRLYGGLF